MKVCIRCEQTKARTEFNVDRARKDGLHTYCKECNRARFRARRERDGVRIREADMARHKRDKAKRLAAQKDWREQNPGYMARVARAWREANPEAHLSGIRRWRVQNAEAARAADARKRAQRRAAYVEDVVALVVLELDDGTCGICGDDVDPTDFHVDHIVPIARGGLHEYANVQVAHPKCNLRKRDKVSL